MVKKILVWIFSHKRLVFIYIPLLIIMLFSLYTGLIYLRWLGDRESALNKLARYKRLIDRTEELRKGYVYRYSDVDLKAKVVDIPTRIYDRNDEIIGEFFEQKREILPLNKIPKWLVKAVIASEDRDYYNHRGISYRGILRAFLVNLIHLRVVQGGSTITQQLAKVLFTDMERSFKRKVYEMFCAHEIEKRYDKQDILSMYLNLIYFGNGAYGVESTSKMFFGKSVRSLNETESAMIVATISNPAIYSPLSNLSNAINKTKRIMQSMIDAGFMNKKRADYQFKRFLKKWDVSFDDRGEARMSLIGSFIFSTYRVNRAPFLNEQIRRVLVERFGEDVVKKGGLRVYTTIDATKQDIALSSLREGISRQRAYHIKRASAIRNKMRSEKEREKADNIEGALVAINPITGEIISYVGGYEFSSANQLDHASQIRRQPGSSFKPIVYAAAIESRDITPSTILLDKKTVFEGGYSPSNYDDEYRGRVIVREALTKSINVIAVKVLQKTGYSRIFDILQDGLSLPGSELHERFGKTLSLTLGTYELSPLENCVLHAIIVNGGEYIVPYGIRYVHDYNGNVVWNNEEEVTNSISERRRKLGRIIDPAACAVTISMLKGVLREEGTAYYSVKYKKIAFPVAGKTGTSTNFNDAWFVGYTSDLVVAVWIGNKTGAITLGSRRSGGAVAAPIWASYISRIYGDNIPGEFNIPDEGFTRQTICLDSGLVPRGEGLCPRVAVDQIFYSGSEPGEYCNIHIKEEKTDSAKSVKR